MGLTRDVVEALRAESAGLRRRAEVIDIMLDMNGAGVTPKASAEPERVASAPKKKAKPTKGHSYSAASTVWQAVLTALQGAPGLTSRDLRVNYGVKSADVALPSMLRAGVVVKTPGVRQDGQRGHVAAIYSLPLNAGQATNGAIHPSEVPSPF